MMLQPIEAAIWDQIIELVSERNENGRITKSPKEMVDILVSEYPLEGLEEAGISTGEMAQVLRCDVADLLVGGP